MSSNVFIPYLDTIPKHGGIKIGKEGYRDICLQMIIVFFRTQYDQIYAGMVQAQRLHPFKIYSWSESNILGRDIRKPKCLFWSLQICFYNFLWNKSFCYHGLNCSISPVCFNSKLMSSNINICSYNCKIKTFCEYSLVTLGIGYLELVLCVICLFIENDLPFCIKYCIWTYSSISWGIPCGCTNYFCMSFMSLNFRVLFQIFSPRKFVV